MTVDDLADLPRRRDCDSIRYFHTDHFEDFFCDGPEIIIDLPTTQGFIIKI
jgi:hypothetical protein